MGGQQFTPQLLERIEALAATEPTLSRRALSEQVCRWLEWRSPNGQFKTVSCRKALTRLERRGLLTLPQARPAPCRSRRRRFELRADEHTASLEMSLAELGEVELVPVGSRHGDHVRVWRALMQRYHRLGDGPLCGAQLRYLIRSPSHGWLGAMAFSASAWRVEARDRFIGWSERARTAHLAEVVCQSRFLVLPQVRVAHLASHVLAQATRRLRADWASRYGYEPVLVETYVETERYRGTCYRAANWQLLGTTAGRGRQDRERAAVRSAKSVFVYPLVRNWRRRLCAEPPRAPERQRGGDWAEEEFSRVCLGDARLHRRVLTVARDLGAHPQAQLPLACGGSPAKLRAAYRLFDHPRVTLQSLLESHYEASAARVAEHSLVLAVQDSTSLNYTAHPMTEGLGPLNTRNDTAHGLWMHDTLAFTAQGTPLGLLDVQCWARPASEHGKSAARERRQFADKESFKWMRSFEALCELQQRCAETTLISVGDREADIYELLMRATRPGAAKLLVRAERTRRMVEQHGALWDYMAARPLAGIQRLEIPRQHNRPKRTATLEIRFAEVELRPPKRKRALPNVRLWAVYAHEPNPPHGVAALDWMLLTTVPVHHFDDALERLAWYRQRWGIETYHRTLKSGCQIEERQLGTAKRLEACLAIDLVVAWRVYHLTHLGRECPDVPCSVFFEDAQWRALCAKCLRQVPEQPPTLNEAVRLVGRLGGHLGRNSDGPPGTKAIWIGLQRLDDITDMFLFFAEELDVEKWTVSSKHDYG